MPVPVIRCFATASLLGLTLLSAAPALASESDELASARRMLVQVQAALERARVASVQADPSERGRFYFDYARATADLGTIDAGIDRYLTPSRAQPRDAGTVGGHYRRERP